MSLIEIYQQYLVSWLEFLWPGLVVSIVASVLSFSVGSVIGLPIALMKTEGPRPIRYVANTYIEVLRGTPALVQLYFVYFGLPSVGITLDALPATVVALGLNTSAYMAEIYRGGLQAVDPGQRQAALALGLTPLETLRHIRLPQAWRVVLPPAASLAIAVFKDSSLASIIALPELTNRAYTLTGIYFQPFAIYLLAGAIYASIALPASVVLRRPDRSRRWIDSA